MPVHRQAQPVPIAQAPAPVAAQLPAGTNFDELDLTDTISCIAFVKATLNLHSETESGIVMELTEANVQAAKLKRVHNNMAQLGFEMPQYTNKDSAMLTIAEKLAVRISSDFGHGPVRLKCSLSHLISILWFLLLNFTVTIRERLCEKPRVWRGKYGLDALQYRASMLMLLYTLLIGKGRFERLRRCMTLQSTPRTLPELHESRELVYALVSLQCESFYVGVTNNMTRRTKEHSTCGAIDVPVTYQRLYSHISKIGIGSYFLIPLHYVRTNVLEEETKFIRHLNPQLNTNKVSRKRKRNLSRPVLAIMEKGCKVKKNAKKCIVGVREYNVHKSGEFESQTSPFLHTLLNSMPIPSTVKIFWPSSNTHDFAHWLEIKRTYVLNIVLPASYIGKFENVIPKIRDQSAVSITVQLRKNGKFEVKEQLLDFVRKPGIWIRKLHSLPLNSLLQLSVEAHNTESSIRSKALYHIQTALRARYGITGIPKLTLRVPQTHSTHTRTIKMAFRAILSSLPFEPEIIAQIAKSFRIVNTSRPSIAQMLHNHIRFAKSFDVREVPQCVCKNFDHPVLKASDFSGITRIVLSTNARERPTPTVYDAHAELIDAFVPILKRLEKLLDQSQENHRNFKIDGVYDPLSTKLCHMFRCRYAPFEYVHELLAEAASLRQGHPHAKEYLSASDVSTARETLKGFVLMGFDKNAGQTAVVCPVRMYRMLKKLLWTT